MFPIFTLLRIVFPVVAVIMVIITVILAINGSKKLQNRAECTGTIVGFYKDTTAMMRNDYETYRISPIVSYTVNGKTYEIKGNYYDTTMKEGKQVTLLYELDDPAKATIKTGVWLGPVITGGIALLFIILSIAFTVVKNMGLI